MFAKGLACFVFLLFAADGAVLGFVVFDRHFEHVVASDADTMDFLARRFRGFGLMLRLSGGGWLFRLAHAQILTLTSRQTGYPFSAR